MKLYFTCNFEYINFNRNKITVICRVFLRLVPTKKSYDKYHTHHQNNTKVDGEPK